MPVKFWDGSSKHRIELKIPGEFLIVKGKFGRDDRLKTKQKLMSAARVTAEGDIEGIDAGVAMEAIQFAILEQATIGGRFQDEDTGEWIEITQSNKSQMLHALDDESLLIVRDELKTLYPEGLSDDERLNSGSSGSTPSETPETRSLEEPSDTPSWTESEGMKASSS